MTERSAVTNKYKHAQSPVSKSLLSSGILKMHTEKYVLLKIVTSAMKGDTKI